MIDTISNWLAKRGGLPVFIAVGLIVVSLIVHLPFALSPHAKALVVHADEASVEPSWLLRALYFLTESDLLLHLGLIVGFLGLLLAQAVGASY